MPLEEPSWWYGAGQGSSLSERLLAPVSAIYGALVERRFKRARAYSVGLPVICVGNFTAGGTGKTPLTRFLIDRLGAQGKTAVCLSRGYGGSLSGPVWVDGAHHTAGDVGDEPLLIAQCAKVMVSRNRKAGVDAIVAAGGADAIVMDDGLQNPSLAKDLSIAVVDARRGLGNGGVIPAGPLRARLPFQLGLVDCIVVMGPDPEGAEAPVLSELRKRFHGPVLRGQVGASGDMSWIEGRKLIAYAGIANPHRFYRLVESFAPEAVLRRSFRDHHPFTDAEAAQLLAEADALGADLITTEKDLARLAGATGARVDLAARSRTLPISVTFEERDVVRLQALLDGALKTRS